MHEKTQAQARVAELEERLEEACEAIRAAEAETRYGKIDLDLAERRSAELTAAAAAVAVAASTSERIARVGNDASAEGGLAAQAGDTPASHGIDEELKSLKKQFELAQDELAIMKAAVADDEDGMSHTVREGVVCADVNGEASFRERLESRLEGLRVAVEEEEQESGAQVEIITSPPYNTSFRGVVCTGFDRGTTLRPVLHLRCGLAT